MRRLLALGALLGVVVLVTPLPAQQPGAFTGANPRNITFTRLDITQSVAPNNVQQMFRTPSQQKPLSLANFFRSFTLPSWPPGVANVSAVQPQNNQFQPNQNPRLNFFPSTGAYPIKGNPYIVSRPTNLQ